MTHPRNPSRRDFLAASAIGLFGLARGPERPPDGDLLYVGTYTAGTRSEGIYLLRMDRRSGELRQMGSVDAGPNPSFLGTHPNGRFLYAVNELERYNGRPTGAVSAFAIVRDTGALTRLNEQPSGGGAPCFVSVDRTGRVALVANYAGGSVALLPIEGNGALAADLGADRVFVYSLDLEGRSLRHVEEGAAVMRAGAGPRHLAFHPTLPLVYVANELDSTVATLRFDSTRGALSPQSTVSTLPAGWTGTNYPADIHVAPNGRALYVSNRGHNSIAVFSVAESTGALALDQVVSTEGDWPRNFTLDPTGNTEN